MNNAKRSVCREFDLVQGCGEQPNISGVYAVFGVFGLERSAPPNDHHGTQGGRFSLAVAQGDGR